MSSVEKWKWKVRPAPVGPCCSFEKRGWPDAELPSGQMVAAIYCDDAYAPSRVKTGQHRSLTVRVTDHSVAPWKWRTLKQQFDTLDQAKEGVAAFFERHPEYLPKE